MSGQDDLRTLDKVRDDELEEILQRRKAADLPQAQEALEQQLEKPPEERKSCKLAGLSLSGGGLRSACFGTGFVQALHRVGLWRLFDYMSTVSGGGYIGAHLTSSALAEERQFDEHDFPLKVDEDKKQPFKIRQLIHGGHYLVKPWRLFNKWLIGVVLVNLALFSAMLAVCTFVALLWRSLDFPWVRERAALLSFGDDLMAPFWPATLFGIAWLLAWLLSFYRRGSEALGQLARFFLYLAVPSFLFGLALLVGNGDIAGGSLLESVFGSSTVSIRPEVWGPVVALILVALLPLLNPRRLMQSGLRPAKKWEKAVFYTVSMALLVGLPLCLVGLLAQENISGYNDFPYRDTIRQDVAGWPSLVAMLLPHQDDEVVGEQALKVNTVRAALARMTDGDGEPLKRADGQSSALHTALANDDAGDGDGGQDGSEGGNVPKTLSMQLPQGRTWDDVIATLDKSEKDGASDALRLARLYNLQNDHRRHPPSDDKAYAESVAGLIVLGGDADVETAAADGDEETTEGENSSQTAVLSYLTSVQEYWRKRDPTSSGRPPRPNDEELFRQLGLSEDISSEPDDDREPWMIIAAANPWQFLYLRTWDLIHVSGARDRLRREVMDDPEYYDPPRFLKPVSSYVGRVYQVIGWTFGVDNEVSQYWEAKERQKVVQAQVVYVLHEWLFADRALLDQQVELLVQSAVGGDQAQAADLDETLRSVLAESRAAYDSGFASLVLRTHRAGAADLQDEDVRRLNRLLLEHSFPKVFRPRSEIRRLISIYKDQWSRFKWLVVFACAFVILGALDLNALSMHHYYRDRVVEAFLVHKPGKERGIPLSEIDATRFGFPYHLISTTVSAPGAFLPPRGSDSAAADTAPEQRRRWLDSFLLSARYCGSQVTGYMETAEYEKRILGDLKKLSLGEAVALSGAAISPGHTKNMLITFLMMALNFRLGQWMPNPRAKRPTRQPRILVLLACLLRYHAKRPYCFVTDGGVSENLGLVQLLRRRCRLIVAVDAGHDPHHNFVDLANAMRIARVHDGIKLVRLDVQPSDVDDELQPGNLYLPIPGTNKENQAACDNGKVKDHFLLAKVEYPGTEPGVLIYVKPSLTGDEPLDLLEYRRHAAEFPHEPTSDQAYDPQQVESYRRLGYHIGTRVGQLFEKVRANGTFWEEEVSVDKLFDELMAAHAAETDESQQDTEAKADAEREGAEEGSTGAPEPPSGHSTGLEERKAAAAVVETPKDPAGDENLGGPAGHGAADADDQQDDRQFLLTLLQSRFRDLSKFEPGMLQAELSEDARSAEWPDDHAGGLLRQLVVDQNITPQDRELVVCCLQRLGGSGVSGADKAETLDVFIAALRYDPAETVRSASAQAIPTIARSAPLRRKAAAALQTALTDSSEKVRWQARCGLDQLDRSARTRKHV